MGSSGLGPRPGELLLAALTACHEVTYRLYADAMDIDLQDVAVSAIGVADARDFSMWMTRLRRDSQKFSARSILSAMPATKGFSGRTFLGRNYLAVSIDGLQPDTKSP